MIGNKKMTKNKVFCTILRVNNDKITVQKVLRELKLTEAEAETYWALLNLETVSIRKVASYTDINRGTTYEALKKLANVGLVHIRRSGQREYYSAESPEKIYDLIRDKRKELWQAQQDANKLIPELLARKARPQGKPLVRYYEDDDGIVTILKDVLQTCAGLDKPLYYAYSSKPLRKYLYRKFPQFTDKRIAEGIGVQVIAIGDGEFTEGLSQRKWLADLPETEMSSYSIIYGDKVAHISISQDYTPYGVVIEDAGTASMQRMLFERLWDTM
jgi:sugar-specific transcriptional regulator TrmB